MGRRRSCAAPCRSLVALTATLLLVHCGSDSDPSLEGSDGPPALEANHEGSRRSVLCLVVDTLRADHLEVYGHDRATSPFLKELGDSSLVFENMYSQASWTKPSVASLFTSLYPLQHYAIREETDNILAESLDTLPEILHEAGYQTAAFTENPHITPVTGFGQGFEEFQTVEGFDGDAPWILEQALAWVRAREPERPFFLYVHFLDPHGPYAPSEPRRSEFLQGRTTEREHVREGVVGQLMRSLKGDLSQLGDDVEYLKALYDAEIRDIDDILRQLYEGLLGEGLQEPLVISFTSDHGEEFMEHGGLKHGDFLYDECLRVPWILSIPGVAPQRLPVSAQHVDVAPTLLEVLGLPIPPRFQGRSMVRAWQDGDMVQRPAVSETMWRNVRRRSVRTGEWKLILDEVGRGEELYRIQDDPGETEDVSDQNPGVVERMKTLLRELTKPVAPAVEAQSQGQRDPELEDALRALGYFDK